MLLLPAVASGGPMLDVVHHVEALELLRALPDGCVDLVLADLPYGITACEWDKVINLEKLWAEFKRVVRVGGTVVLTATMLFAVDLINAARDWFRYDLMWDKVAVTGFLDANRKPLRRHESALVFCEQGTVYNPQMRQGSWHKRGDTSRSRDTSIYGDFVGTVNFSDKYFPSSIVLVPNCRTGVVHPTQKPVKLFEWLIRTYSNVGDVVLDPTVGSGTTAVAARNTGRRYICGDISREYVEVARERLAEPYTPDMFEGQVGGNGRGQARQMSLLAVGEGV